MQEARLERLPPFESLTPDERSEIEALLEPASFADGEVLLEEGGPGEYLYILTSGAAEVFKEVFPGRKQRLATVEAPTVVGELALMTEHEATATVSAKGAVEAQRIPREAFLEKLETGSDAAYKVAYEIGRTLAGRMAKTDECIAGIVARLEDAKSYRDFDVFRDKILREWSF